MNVKTVVSAAILGLSGAALAQVATPVEPKLGNGANANVSTPVNGANAADPAANAADPGKH